MLDSHMNGSYYPLILSMDPEAFDAELAARGLDTQVKAAAAIGISQGSVSLYKNGKLPVPRVVINALRAIPRTAQVTRQTKRGRNGKAKNTNK